MKIAFTLFLVITLSVFISCNNNRDAAAVGAVVATAATLQVVQTARSQGTPSQQPTGECCMICEECRFPCGDVCVPFGTFCAAPAGCACASEPDEHRDIPMEDKPPSSCPERYMVPVPLDPVDM